MKYGKTLMGRFISRPNRFIANVEINGKTELCHVKNTGRCREMLISGAKVVLEESPNPARKTKYDLISVYKGSRLINMDSQAPNKIFGEYVRESGLFGKITLLRPETKYKNSRFDFYIENETEKIFVEVKGVTLEKDGAVFFPDAPTERGVKHIKELISAKAEGFRAGVVFIVQMENADYFSPSDENHPEFASALREAARLGVEIYAFSCRVTPDSAVLDKPVEIRL